MFSLKIQEDENEHFDENWSIINMNTTLIHY
jgi:hypothetical protein